MVSGYAALLCGSLLSAALLVITFRKVIRIVGKNNNLLNDSFPVDEIQYMMGKKKFQLIQQLNHWGFRILSIGFLFLTIGVVWANEAWGSYWNWDPKETCAFITWTIFAIYFHTRTNKNLEGLNSTIVASIGLLIILICYFGVNLLGIGLHSYGSFTLISN
ncbi:cytochrome c heme attachment protein [Populus alba x Populus x berolinensis]|nr:cytochrome c heme attachment protein [Populus alba x Populus x berolinensis]